MNKTIQEKIKELAKEKNAIILAHYYQNPEIQDIADYVGDSLALSRIASTTKAKIIVFCGVDFMGETAKILSPDKKVLIPDDSASCIMAKFITKNALKQYKEEHPDTIIITYVNSYAEVKALSDVCVTSSNALKIISHYAQMGKKILYCPDKNLGNYANITYGYQMDLWNGCCPRHNNITPLDVEIAQSKHPKAKLLVHPECPYEVVKMSTYAGSTKQLLDYCIQDESQEYIIATEMGVIHAMEKACPNKKFYPLVDDFICEDMKKNTLEKVLHVLEHEDHEIILEEDILKKAKLALDKMLELS
jgi:quinolinate synthase